MMLFFWVWWINVIRIILSLLKHTFISSGLKDSDERVEMKMLASTPTLSHNHQGLATSFVTIPVYILLYAT